MDDTAPADLASVPDPPTPDVLAEQSPRPSDAAGPAASPIPGRPAWRTLARPQTLVLVAAPVAVTVALLVAHGDALLPLAAALTLLAALLTQTGANMLDAYLEIERARHSSWLAGTVDHAGHPHALGMQPLSVLRASIALIALGGCAGIPLILFGGWQLAALGAVGLLTAFLYSATSYAIKRLPAGELPIFFALGPGLTLATAFAQRQRPTLDVLLLGCALGLLATAVVELARLRNAALGRVGGGTGRLRAGRLLTTLSIAGAYACVLVAALTSVPASGAIFAFFSLPIGLVAITGALSVRSAIVARLAARDALRAYYLFAGLLLLGIRAVPAALSLWQAL
jgi:1,4-dihydroxy-2-naphthoate octaprenyltransferase